MDLLIPQLGLLIGEEGDEGRHEPGDVKRLRRRGHQHRVSGRLLADAGVGHRGLALLADRDERSMDLVGDDEPVVTLDDLGQSAQLVRSEDATQRVVGLTEDDRPGTLGEGRVDAVKVEGPAQVGVDHRHRDDLASFQSRHLPERHVCRGRDDHGASGSAIGADGQLDSGQDIAQITHLERIDRQALDLLRPCRP